MENLTSICDIVLPPLPFDSPITTIATAKKAFYEVFGLQSPTPDEVWKGGGQRIHDIVNVLESFGVLSKKVKNKYSWNGFGALPKALQDLNRDCGSASDGVV
ncbi:hypothetical protein Csa_017769 [Cucumis sativus]|nr:hypothetical protein Csa_017769 [Cucumis sativus]